MAKNVFSQLIEWSEKEYAHLPWRAQRTLYRTLVSEIMLQQTTVSTVLNHFERFIEEYPTLHDLARSTEEQICVSWKGLGYYRRARSLRGLAIQIVERYDGLIPSELPRLLELKGIGPYTANALVAIGGNQKALAVDANLERVLARFYGVELPKGVLLQKELWKQFAAGKILTEMDKLSPRALNEAFMDLGRIVCQARKATCESCPLALECVANKEAAPLRLPLNAGEKKAKKDLFLNVLRVVVKKDQKILFYQKGEKEWLAGQWELPTFILDTNDESLKQYPRIKNKKSFENLPVIKTGITKYSIQNKIVEMSVEDFEEIAREVSIEYEFKTFSKTFNASTSSLKVLQSLV